MHFYVCKSLEWKYFERKVLPFGHFWKLTPKCIPQNHEFSRFLPRYLKSVILNIKIMLDIWKLHILYVETFYFTILWALKLNRMIKTSPYYVILCRSHMMPVAQICGIIWCRHHMMPVVIVYFYVKKLGYLVVVLCTIINAPKLVGLIRVGCV